MPNLIGMTPNDAQSRLKNLGWFGKWYEGTSKTICELADLSSGAIADQSPAPGALMDPEQAVDVGICSPLPGPGLRRQPVEVEIHIADVVVLTAPAPTPAPRASSGLTSLHWILLLVILALVIVTSVALRFMRRPTRHRPLPEPSPPSPWTAPPPDDQPEDRDSTSDRVTLRLIDDASRIVVQPPGGPRHAHRVRLAVHPDPGTRTVQEDHRGRH